MVVRYAPCCCDYLSRVLMISVVRTKICCAVSIEQPPINKDRDSSPKLSSTNRRKVIESRPEGLAQTPHVTCTL